MSNVIQPFYLRVVALAGWFDRHQQAGVGYLGKSRSSLTALC